MWLLLQITEFANAQYPITSLSKLPFPDLEQDLLLCAGYFNELQIYSDGKVGSIATILFLFYLIVGYIAKIKCVHYKGYKQFN